MTHGTEYAYTRRGCRCDLCRVASNAARRRRRRTPHVNRHGANGYANGCRCAACLRGHLARIDHGRGDLVSELHPDQLQLLPGGQGDESP